MYYYISLSENHKVDAKTYYYLSADVAYACAVCGANVIEIKLRFVKGDRFIYFLSRKPQDCFPRFRTTLIIN